MGFFDRFKKQDKPQETILAAGQAGAPLAFQADGNFEIAFCPGEDALKHLEQLRSEGRSAGFTAILLGGKDDAEGLAENREFSKTPTEEYLRLAAEVKAEDWLKKQVEADPECFQAEAGEWPSEVPEAGNISAHLEVLSKKPKKAAYLAKIPSPRNWEAPAYIGMGGWNACPDAAVLTAFAKRWHERYGAEVVSITHDVIEFTVANPPSTREAAMELAKEQYVFCSDIVDQGVGDVSTLAATLLNSNYWYFWWD
jgi:hypothetical protein